MTQKHDSFKPDRVDEQVDQLSLNLSGERATGQQQTRESTPKDERIEFQQEARTRFVRELQAYYQIEFQQHQQFLEHAWQQITAHQIAEQADRKSVV